MSCLCLFVYSVRQRWTLCTGTWRAAARPRLPWGPLRRGTATSWRTTCGGCPSGPASTFSSCWPLPSLKSTHCDACLMTKSGSARSTNKIFSPQPAETVRNINVFTLEIWGQKIPRLALDSFCTENFVHSLQNVVNPWKPHLGMAVWDAHS